MSACVTALAGAKGRDRSIEGRQGRPPGKIRARAADRRFPQPRRGGRRDRGAPRRDGEAHARARQRDPRRAPAAPEEYAALQASRLNEALLVAMSAMSPANLKAVALVVRIVRELDRYHGFVPAARRPRRGALAEAVVEGDTAQTAFEEARLPSALDAAAPPAHGPRTAPQALEKSESAPENCALPAAPEEALPASVGPQEAAAADASGEAPPPRAAAEDADPAAAATLPRGAQMAPQATEILDSAPEASEAPGLPITASALPSAARRASAPPRPGRPLRVSRRSAPLRPGAPHPRAASPASPLS